MNTAFYALSLEQTFNLILKGGNKRTVLAQGHMGTGKSSMLGMLAEALPDHTPCYFDCTTKDLGDISIPQLQTIDDQGFVKFVPNEELGVHLGKPIILMVDEYGKANPAVKNALLRLMLERKIGGYTLHEDSIVFATTNLGAEGVGDLLPPHALNRITVVNVRKSDNMEYIEWGIANGVDPIVLGFAKENPQLFQSFEEVSDPKDNPDIYHPKEKRAAFVTNRSLTAASDWVKLRDELDNHTLTAALGGTIGMHAAGNLMAFIALHNQLPKLDDIKSSPETAKVPDGAAAICMLVYRALAVIDRSWVDAWMTYLVRLSKEAQGMFANGVRADKYDKTKKSIVMTNKKFTEWALANNYMFAADKK